jgi:alpha-D-xyloside xylohydrolase
MKFRDGDWLMRDGVRAFHPAVAHRVVATNDRLTVLAPTVAPRDRSEMHDLVALTVELSSPTVDVIRVRVTHHAGARRTGPYFPVFEGVAPGISVVANDSVASLQSGRLTARLNRSGPWRLDFVAEGRILTSSDAEGMAAIEWPGHGERSLDASRVGRFMAEALSLGVGEHVYGLGERFGPFVKNGQSIDIWNRDGGTGLGAGIQERAVLSDRRRLRRLRQRAGEGRFRNSHGTSGACRFQRGRPIPGVPGDLRPEPQGDPRKVHRSRRTSCPAARLVLRLVACRRRSQLTTTRPLSRSFVDGMAEREIPLSVLHFDSFWMREFQWVDFTWDERVFPDPVGMLARLHERGLRVCVWINPYIAQASPLFEEAAAAGFLLKRQNGDPWQGDQWQPGMGIVDFTNPGARTWYRSKLAALAGPGCRLLQDRFRRAHPN